MTARFARACAVLACGASLALTAAPATAAPALRVDTAGAVKPGQQLTVSLDGLPAGLPMVAIGQCTPQVRSPADCNLTGSLLGTADAAGVWRPNGPSSAITLIDKVGGVDCAAAPGACTLAVTSLTDPTAILASVPLSFGDPAPPATAAAPAATDPQDSGDHIVAVVAGVAVVAVAAAAALLWWRRRTG